MKKTLLALLAGLIVAPAAARGDHNLAADYLRPTIKVHKVKNFNFDDALNDPAWKKSDSHKFMRYMREPEHIRQTPVEGGSVKYLYDDNYFYVRGEFIDSDVMTTATAHGGHFYVQGDVLEIFIKPVKDNYYWEIYGTPNGLRTRFYYPGRATVGVPSGFAPNDLPIKVKSAVVGTLNDCKDKDTKWSIVLRIPRSELEKNGLKFDAPSQWRVFAARYNYGRYFDTHELSSFPQIPHSYHLHEYYADIEFVK